MSTKNKTKIRLVPDLTYNRYFDFACKIKNKNGKSIPITEAMCLYDNLLFSGFEEGKKLRKKNKNIYQFIIK